MNTIDINDFVKRNERQIFLAKKMGVAFLQLTENLPQGIRVEVRWNNAGYTIQLNDYTQHYWMGVILSEVFVAGTGEPYEDIVFGVEKCLERFNESIR